MADQEPFTSSHGVITAASSSFFPYILHSATKIGKTLVQLSNIVCVTGRMIIHQRLKNQHFSF